MQKYKVTILIANFNYGRFLESAIFSALGQTYKPQTIVLCDDNSSDNSWEIISRFAEQNQREEKSINTPQGDILVKLGNISGIDILGIKLPVTSGPSECRNLAIQMTSQSTDIYSVLDSDDQMLPNKLEECLKPFQDPLIGLTYSNYFNVNEETGLSLLEVKEPFSVDRLNQECIVHSGFLIRREILEKIKDENGYYDRTMRVCEDWDVQLRASNHCLFYHIPIPLTLVLVHKSNSTNSVQKEVWNAHWQRIQQKHFSQG